MSPKRPMLRYARTSAMVLRHSFHHNAYISHPLGNRLKLERQNQGRTIDALATESGVSRSMISKVERGEAQPTTSVLGKLAEALDLSISLLLVALFWRFNA